MLKYCPSWALRIGVRMPAKSIAWAARNELWRRDVVDMLRDEYIELARRSTCTIEA